MYLKENQRTELVHTIFRKYIDQFKFVFNDDKMGFHCCKPFVRDLVYCMYHYTSRPGEVLLHYKEMPTDLIFILKGSATILDTKAKTIEPLEVTELEEGSYFGDWNYFMNIKSGF